MAASAIIRRKKISQVLIGAINQTHIFMKKSLLYLTACALVIAACSKKEEEAIMPDINEGRIVTLNASVSDNNTKVAVVDHKYNWQAGDKVAVFQADGSQAPITFEAESSAASSKLIAVTDKTVGKYAVYPYDPADAAGFEWAEVTGDDIMTIVLPDSYIFQENALNIPMLGTISGDNVTFKAIGGVIRMTVNNIPATAQYFSFAATNKQIAGEFMFEASATTPQLDLVDGATGKEITIEFTPGTSSRVFSIPCPVGTIDGFTLSLYDDGLNELYSVTSAANVAVERNDVIIAPALNVPDPEEVINTTRYEKVTSAPLANGDYLLVFEDGADAYIFNGEDAVNGYVTGTISDDVIASTSAIDAVALTVEAMTGGYSFLINSGSHSGKYLEGKVSNGMTFADAASAHSVSYTSGVLTLQDINHTETTMRFNSASNQLRFRYYTSGQQEVALYKKTSFNGTKLNAPTGLKVTADTKTVSWKPVYHATSYDVTVGTTTENVTSTSYVFAGEDEYYDVSVIAKSTDPTKMNSDEATLSNAKFGNPTLTTPSLTKGTVTVSSITVNWTNDDRATNGYYCSISDGGSYENFVDNVTSGTVTFNGLTAGTDYTITVYAKAVSSPLAYAQSGNGTKAISTAAVTTIAAILSGSDTDAKSLAAVTVLAVSTKGVYIGDDTGSILAIQNSTSPYDLEVGDVVDVSGTAGSTNSQRRLTNCTITKTTGTPISIGTPTVLTASGLTTLASTFSRQYVSLEGKVTNVSGSYYNIQIGTETGAYIALYNPIASITGSIVVGQYVAVTGRTLYVTGNTPKYVYIMADSFTIHTLSAASPSVSWEYNESGSANKVSIAITSDNNAWTIDDSDVSSWAAVSKNGTNLEIYPKDNNGSGSNYTGDVVLTHAVATNFKMVISCTQLKQGGSVTPSPDTYTMTSADASGMHAEYDGVAGSLVLDKGSNNSNGPVWNDSDKTIRLYKNNTITVSATSAKIASITMTVKVKASGGVNPSIGITTGGGTISPASCETSTTSITWTAGATDVDKVVLTLSNNNGNIGFKSIVVTYK